MTYKLINPEHPVVHDYTVDKAHVSHLCVAASDTFPVKFKELETHGVRGTYRTAMTIQPGDLIFKDMSSGRIGVYEVQKVTGSKVPSELCEPFRDQSLVMYFMGYFGRDNRIEIWNGYGELPEEPATEHKFRPNNILVAILVISYIAAWAILLIK